MSEPAVEITLGAAPAAAASSDVTPLASRPAAEGSALADLRSRRAKLVKELWIDLEVPRWADDGGPAIWVRYGPVPPGLMAGAAERRMKQKSTLRDEWVDYANCDVLVQCCIGVYAKDGDGTYSLRPGDEQGEWTKFDADLAAALGVESARAVDVCRALYFTGDDRTMAVTQLTDWSAQESTKVDKDAQGN